MSYSFDYYNCNDLFDIWDGGLPMRSYVADFETTTDPEDCRVWAWGVSKVGDDSSFEYGNTIESFIDWCDSHANCRVYFHNLAFDGTFLLDWISRNGWEWRSDDKGSGSLFYTTLIGDTNQFYSVTMCFNRFRKVQFYDSLKIIPMSVEQMAKSYGLEMLKGHIDYDAYREPGHILTEEEVSYLKNDVLIVSQVVKMFHDAGLNKMTIGSNALWKYKETVGKEHGFRTRFPIIDADTDEFIRRAYKGGFTYADKRFRGKEVGEGLVFDINSLYPSVMYYEDMPCGNPHWFDGEPDFDDWEFPLWIAKVTCYFGLKEKHIPCIQLKGNLRFKQTEYLEYSDGMATMTVSSVDWKLYNEQYDIQVVQWHGGFKFCAIQGMFRKYIDFWMEEKVRATEEGNSGRRQIAKLMLNSLYGKFATRNEAVARKPVFEDGTVSFEDLEPEERKPVYLPVGIFITAYARYKTVSSAQMLYDRFLYADTDSLHILGTDIPEELDIDQTELGAWKHEGTFKKAKFLRAKCYMEEYEDGTVIHVAGMPKYMHDQVSMENFALGAVYDGKLYQKRVPGGIVLVPGEMELRK